MEIERKFLLLEGETSYVNYHGQWPKLDGLYRKSSPELFGLKLLDVIDIEQGYLDTETAGRFAFAKCFVDINFNVAEARIRRQRGKRSLVFKSDGTLQRHKVEIPIDDKMFEQLWSEAIGTLRKRRLIYTDGKYEIKVNLYYPETKPLIVAEVEFFSEAEANGFEWYGKDVTDDPKYKNRNLAR